MTHNEEFRFTSIAGIIVGVSLFAYAYAATEPPKDTSIIPGKYIVVLRENAVPVEELITEMEKKHGVAAEMRYSKALKGFSANLSTVKLAKMRLDPRVAFVSEDREVRIDSKAAPAGGKSQALLPSQAADRAEEAKNAGPNPILPPDVGEVVGEGKGNGKGKGNVTTGTSTVPDQPTQSTPLNIKRVRADGLANKGTGVGVAIIDTGIDSTHPDLMNNVSKASKSCVSGVVSAQDDNGHGTHVAGVVAAANNSIGTVGVAPEATLYAVKVLDSNGAGTWSSLICGIDWVTANAKALNIKVANMSLGGPGTSDNACGTFNGDALHRAICNSTAQGVSYVVASGNSGADSSGSVPASYDDTVIAVSAIVDTDGQFGGFGAGTPYGSDDTFASFSNYGPSVDIAAPGVNILSTWKGGTYKVSSGTSMATPHVSAAAALYLKNNPTASWSQVREALRYFGEGLGAGHTDPTRLHYEPVVNAILP